MGSTRLPGKVLMLLDKKHTTLDYIINQLKHSKLLGKIIIATTNLEEDNVIVDFAKKNKIAYFRGDSDDVLDRYYKCAEKFSLDTIVRITSDEPFIDPMIVDQIIINFQKISCDYASNNLTSTFPAGFDAEVFSRQALERAWTEAKLPSEREHVTPFMKKNKNIFTQFNLKNPQSITISRLTLDRKEDLNILRTITSKILERPILFRHIFELFEHEPDLLELCNNIDPLEGYNKSLKKDEKFLTNSKRC
jgi:spore coat polysaccharide biosynthesis protein SpsF|tara:strand:+ start:109 stop:855 length:747 start_codon:yes stop_codon:yes gene_type:complete